MENEGILTTKLNAHPSSLSVHTDCSKFPPVVLLFLHPRNFDTPCVLFVLDSKYVPLSVLISSLAYRWLNKVCSFPQICNIVGICACCGFGCLKFIVVYYGLFDDLSWNVCQMCLRKMCVLLLLCVHALCMSAGHIWSVMFKPPVSLVISPDSLLYWEWNVETCSCCLHQLLQFCQRAFHMFGCSDVICAYLWFCVNDPVIITYCFFLFKQRFVCSFVKQSYREERWSNKEFLSTGSLPSDQSRWG